MVVETRALDDGAAARLAALSEVLDTVARLHDREVEPEFLTGFVRHRVAEWIGRGLSREDGRQAASALGLAAADIDLHDESELDDLAAEYADIYLTHGYRVAPNGSVWLTEDRLERQLPMFEAREWYAHYDVSVPDWRKRPDDHIVYELQFLSLLCGKGSHVCADDAARFLDVLVLPWVPEFCARAGTRVRQPLYVALFALTAAVLDELRDELEQITGRARAIRKAPSREAPAAQAEQAAYVPGLTESW